MRTDIFHSQDFFIQRLGCVPARHPSSRKPSWKRQPRFEQSTVKPSDSGNRCEFRGRDRMKKSSSSSVSFDGRDFTDQLGRDPVFVSKQIRLSDRNIYAGSAFSQSPSPRSLPLPTFAKKKEGTVDFEDSATKNLRRLLRLD